jgi:hypothetical protein
LPLPLSSNPVPVIRQGDVGLGRGDDRILEIAVEAALVRMR